MAFLAQLDAIDGRRLNLLERLLLVNDGTLTDALEMAFLEPIALEKLSIELTDSGLRIILEQVEPSGSLRVVMEWVAGEPWWSTIECTENPPPTSRLPGQVVAAGYLLKGSIVTKERAPAPR